MKELVANYSFFSRIPLLIVFEFTLGSFLTFIMYKDFKPITLLGPALLAMGLTMLIALASNKKVIEISAKGITYNNFLSWVFKPFYIEWANIINAEHSPISATTVIPVKSHYIKISYKKPIEKSALLGLIKYKQDNVAVNVTSLNIGIHEITEIINHNVSYYNKFGI